MSLPIEVCSACGYAAFPTRLLCPRCGARAWRPDSVAEGRLSAWTARDGVVIGEVATDSGAVVIARVEGDAALDATVALADDGGVAVATVIA